MISLSLDEIQKGFEAAYPIPRNVAKKGFQYFFVGNKDDAASFKRYLEYLSLATGFIRGVTFTENYHR